MARPRFSAPDRRAEQDTGCRLVQREANANIPLLVCGRECGRGGAEEGEGEGEKRRQAG